MTNATTKNHTALDAAALYRRGIEAAARLLTNQGYDVIERNWKCEAGEMSIIAREDKGEGAVVFVEVTMCAPGEGFGEDVVDNEKRAKVENVAALFFEGYEITDVPVRFDIMSLRIIGKNRALIRQNKGAFN